MKTPWTAAGFRERINRRSRTASAEKVVSAEQNWTQKANVFTNQLYFKKSCRGNYFSSAASDPALFLLSRKDRQLDERRATQC